MASQITEQNKARLKEIATRYPRNRSAILPAFHLVMQQHGWVSEETCVSIAEILEVPAVEVFDALSFYTYIPRKPLGKYHIQVCHNISCHLNGVDELIEHLEKKHHIREGETTEDGLFSLSMVECLGACGGSPVIQVAGTYYENMTIKKLDNMIGRWKMMEAKGAPA
jgi:NADH-quinone oxidoreductase subunit E